jgi:hypothetical protein
MPQSEWVKNKAEVPREFVGDILDMRKVEGRQYGNDAVS